MPYVVPYLFCCLFFPVASFAQTIQIDSLRQRATALPAGHEKINTLLHLSQALVQTDWETALATTEEVVQMAQQLRRVDDLILGYWKQSEFYLLKYKYAQTHFAIEQTIQLATQQRDSSTLTDALFRQANCFEVEGKIAESIRVGQQALFLGERIHWNPTTMAGQYCKVGWNLGNTGNFEKALAYCQKGLTQYQQLRYFQGECYAFTQFSLIYGIMGDNVKALEMQQKALEIAQKNKNKYWRVVALHNICDIQVQLGNFEQALAQAQQLDTLNRVLKDPNAYLELHRLRGRIYYALKDVVQAQTYFQKALDLGLKINNPSFLSGVWKDMTPALIALKQTQRAEKGLSLLIQDLEHTKDSSNLALCKMLLGEVKAAEGDVAAANALFATAADFYKQKTMLKESGDLAAKMAQMHRLANQPEQALAAALQSLVYLEKTHSKTAIADAHLLLYQVYNQQADYRHALFHHEQHFLYLDSVKTQDLRRRLAEERIKQHVEDIEAEKANAERETQLLATQNRLYLALGAALLAILLAGAYFFVKLRKAKNLLNQQNLQLAQLNQTKDKFFGIIAHDLRNPLIAFQGVGAQLGHYLEKGDTPKLQKISALISQSAVNLSALLDNLLSWALLNRGMIPYQPEPLDLASTVAESFAVYEHNAAAKGIRLSNHVPAHTRVQADQNALLAILRNLIGNAIKFTHADRDGHVTIRCEPRGTQLFISVTDNGTGIATHQLERLLSLEKRPERGTAGEKGAGLGLILCRELVDLHKGTLHISSTAGQGCTVVFSLPTL